MISNLVSSSEVILNVIDRYNIKSEDFVSRAGKWITECIDDLGYIVNLKSERYYSTFNNNRILLPPYCKNVVTVLIDGEKVDYNESLYSIDSTASLNRGIGTISNNNLGIPSSIPIIAETDTSFISSGMPMFYRLSNGWLHTNVATGEIEIIYKKYPTEFNDVLALELPVIPNEFDTKEAIASFILKTILMRGYIHPILNLKENNSITNPGIAYKNHKRLSRINLNAPNVDAREKYSNPMAALFGKRRKLYVPTELALRPSIEVESTRWRQDGLSYCEVINGNNTGILLVPMVFQQLVAGVWVDTITTKIDRISNILICPILLYRAAYCIGDVYTAPITLIYSDVTPIIADVEPVDAYNYLYISIPNNRTFTSDTGQDFDIVAIDAVGGYITNNVYKSRNKFYTGLSFQFTIEIV